MRRSMIIVLSLLLLGSVTANAQFGKWFDKAKKVMDATKDWSPEQEEAIGSASAAKLIHIFGLYDNPAMVKYVNLVGNAVARQSTRQIPYHFAILDTDTINAVALPGGYIFITRGALANMNDESQLAGTLAHEVEHVADRHLEKEIRAKKLIGMGAEEGTSHLPTPSQLNEFANKIVSQALSMPYSRDKESDADRKGTEIAAQAGYDPTGLRNFLGTLQKASANDPSSHRALALWGNTHPPLDQRIASLDSILKEMSPGGQVLAERFQKNVNFDQQPAAAAPAAAPATANTAASGTASATPAKSAEQKTEQKTIEEKKPVKKKWGLPLPH